MDQTNTYDVLVLGGGPGGYTAAFRAADLGLSVCLVEKEECLGGVCLHKGCIPSKTLLHGVAFIEKSAVALEYGIGFQTPTIDIHTLIAKKESVINKLTDGLDKLTKARKITRMIGKGAFKNNSTLTLEGKNKLTEITFSKAIIATGSSPSVLPFLPDDPRIWNSTDALELQSIPKRFLIIGGGIIGLEMARIYHGLGSAITIVEILDHIIPSADKDLIQPLFLQLKKKYRILTKTRVAAIKTNAKGIIVDFEGAQASESAEFDAVLCAVGRHPNTKGMGLENLDIQLNSRGFIDVNAQQQTSLAHFYAAGDVVGEPMLAHKATHEAKVAAENIAGNDAYFSPKSIPSIAYTDPEIAWTGLTEKEAKEKGVEYNKAKFPWGASGRAQSCSATTGTTKVLFDSKSGKIIGAGICGRNGGELIHEAVMAIEKEATAREIAQTVHAHPTLAETFGCAAEIIDGSITDALPARKKKREQT